MHCAALRRTAPHADARARLRRSQCARYGELAEVSELLAAGVAADAADAEGRTALFLAAANGHAAVVQLLLANGAVRGDAAGVLRHARWRVVAARSGGDARRATLARRMRGVQRPTAARRCIGRA